MLDRSLPYSHYFPWDDSDTFAACGHPMTAADVHATQPTCPACAARLAAEDAAFAETPLPLDADEARTELDPVLNAGVSQRAPMSPLGAELFAIATTLNACYALTLLERGGRR